MWRLPLPSELVAPPLASNCRHDHLREALRFGADKVFRSKTAEISDADIDAILEVM